MLNSEIKEVDFNMYCERCKYWADGKEIPYCDDCLEEAKREGTHVPLKWEPKVNR